MDIREKILKRRLMAVAIVSARDEQETIGAVVVELQKLPLTEIVVVANGCHDHTAAVARRHGARVLEFDQPLGHDVGRAVGAAQVLADIYLFTDGDVVLRAVELLPFLAAVADGVDVALNDLNPFASDRSKQHVVNVAKIFFNYAIGLPELGINSLTAIPHALSRRALETIGCDNLMVPPKALFLAKQAGLMVKAVASVNVISRNRWRPEVHQNPFGPLDALILGDHLEALAELIRSIGPRGAFPDYDRQRAIFHPASMDLREKTTEERR